MAIAANGRIEASVGFNQDPAGGTQLRGVIVVWAEENGALDAANEWSFGNGATGAIGIPMLGDWELYGVSSDIESSSGALPTFEVVSFVGSTANNLHVWTPAGATDAQELTSPVFVPHGTLLGFQTASGGGSNTDGRLAAWLRQA